MEDTEKIEETQEITCEGLDSIPQQVKLEEEKGSPEQEPEKKLGKKSRLIAQLKEELKKSKEETKENYDKYLRALADLDNYRKRVRKELAESTQLGKEGLLLEILPVLDNLKRALNSDHFSKDDHFHRGVEMIYNQFMGVLVEEGLKEIEVLGKPFDPSLHEAVLTVVSWEHEPETIVQELEPGYMFGERVIRPAKVKVTKGPEPSQDEEVKAKESSESTEREEQEEFDH